MSSFGKVSEEWNEYQILYRWILGVLLEMSQEWFQKMEKMKDDFYTSRIQLFTLRWKISDTFIMYGFYTEWTRGFDILESIVIIYDIMGIHI